MGQVIDALNKQPLADAKITVIETSLSYETDSTGRYFILNIPSGEYDVAVSATGYTNIKYTNIQIVEGLSTRLNFELIRSDFSSVEDPISVEHSENNGPVMVDNRVIRKSKDIELLPARNIRDVILLTPGVSAGHFHGGYENDVNYLVDGVSFYDPATGSSQNYIPQLAFEEINVINNSASVEYGNALSGTINQFTMEGDDHLAGAIDFKTNDMSSTFIGERDQLKDIQGRLSGSLPYFSKINNGNLYYMFSGQYFDTNGRFENDDSTLTSSFGKLTYKITPRHKLTFSGAVSNSQYTYFAQGSDENLWSRTTYEDRLRQFYPYLDDGSYDPGNVYIDENGDPWYGNNSVDSEDLNRNGVIDPGEDLDDDGAIDTEDLNHNFRLDSHRMFDHTPYYNSHTEQFTLRWDHSISSRTFYDLHVSRYKTAMNYNTRERFNEDTNGNEILDLELRYSTTSDIPAELWDREYNGISYRDLYRESEGFVFFDFNQNGVYEYEDLNGNEIWDWDVYGSNHDLFKDENNNGYIDASEGNPKDEWLRWQDINFFGNTKDNDDFMNYGSGKTYSRNRWGVDERDTWNIKGIITSQVHRNHQVKSGVDVLLIEQLFHNVDMASGGNVYGENFDYRRKIYGFWIEDKLEFKRLAINAGLRLDIEKFEWGRYPNDIAPPIIDPVDPRELGFPGSNGSNHHHGERLGIDIPITKRLLIGLNYAKNARGSSKYFTFQNSPVYVTRHTTTYDFTFRFKITPDLFVTGNNFFKEIYETSDNPLIFYYPNNMYGLYLVPDTGLINGYEITIEKQLGRYFGGSFSYTSSTAKSKISSPSDYGNEWSSNFKRDTEAYLDWDQIKTVIGSLQIIIPRGTQPFNQRWLDEWMISLVGQHGSGLPFSSPSRDHYLPINDRRLPNTLRFDTKIQKRFSLTEYMTATINLQGFNIFDRRNINQQYFQAYADKQWYLINDADGDGEPDKDVDGVHNNPMFWERGRMLQLGLSFEF
ncbi:MAG: carboxypeptidase regulatory-like domain-containing protein [Candidatus Electryonea clarkiae]|nr:carboxypeptidase regulatory-like domain-containing protein [Candidatus Electryonea clarkiae]MDP8287277.1 carboxypeptidase regulatory-like domain-containing protein [Candidatus Electryonea clarkiae]